MSANITIRRAGSADAPILARHRVAMFHDMGSIDPEWEAPLLEASTTYFSRAVASGEYHGWIAFEPNAPEIAVASAGVQLRSLLPRPHADGNGVLLGREGLVLNVYTGSAWRRRGLARRLMNEIIAWAPTAGVVRLVLHASQEGRPLYDALGFVSTNELRYTGALASSGSWLGSR